MLNISGLTKTYPNGVKALNGINLSIPKGMFGLLGPNGAGKSSLMRTIATLQTPDTGTIQFDDIDVLADPNGLRQRLGYLPQDFGVYPRISAEKLLDHLAVLKGINNSSERKDAVESLLVHTNLWQHRDKAVSGYSGGMRQRFGIAQALLGDPDLIIVDEPTAGLDPEERNRFHNLLVSLGEEKVIILSTHIVDDVSELCPKMAVLGQGKILLEGNPISLTHELTGRIWRKQVSQDEYRELQQHLNIISARLIAGKHVIHVMADTSPEGFEQAPANLEDVYFSTLHNSRAATAA
ncbi:MAG TPA: multidrug ABC transporter ATP-binding protein [Alteromonas australica]|uniref:Multidrug ABC transporter ATP-binding protein n=1 Tax=Alteromonas australica TaxID=589873 RepID=A0A350P0Y7_9ALTE|nr:ABC transporter ATP-binding protein [Alteromonas australica]MAF71578.1 multidrug ABC transporter ATP-binding protein [Alteromonas sp.]MBU35162.1 multidrug ABC transporter ATP-binding protein [Alteromonas sp.]HAI71068.1 multidrug ABC transporter ATP-binding protein [Alteromonas australica]HAU27400.1 multidrug ABC transporter ATP-binding protein [Alteromonas australica]HAW74954.1 multidrug ABC transporter ATP-binding protein [Alteromonas australica]